LSLRLLPEEVEKTLQQRYCVIARCTAEYYHRQCHHFNGLFLLLGLALSLTPLSNSYFWAGKTAYILNVEKIKEELRTLSSLGKRLLCI
jgi:hypothetical protein